MKTFVSWECECGFLIDDYVLKEIHHDYSCPKCGSVKVSQFQRKEWFNEKPSEEKDGNPGSVEEGRKDAPEGIP